jgi:hypothetical protein
VERGGGVGVLRGLEGGGVGAIGIKRRLQPHMPITL